MKEIKKVLSKRVDKLEKSYTDYQNNPYDSKTCHALRVSARKLRSLLNFLKHTFDKEDYDRLNGELKALAQIYGPLREMDVLIGVCNEIARRAPELSTHYREAFKYLHQQRNKEMRRTFNKTNTRSAESAIKTVNNGIEEIPFEVEGDWEAYITRRLKKKNSKLADDYQNAELEDYEAVHDIRKRTKKLRYAARYFGSLASLKHKKIMKKAEEIQDDFGKITDAHVNQDLLEQFAEKVEDKDLKAVFQKMSQEQQRLAENRAK